MMSRILNKLPINISDSDTKVVNMEDPASPVVDLQRNHLDSDQFMECSPKSVASYDEEPSVDIKCKQGLAVPLCGQQTKKSNVTCFDGQTEGRVDVLGLVNSLLVTEDNQQCEELHPDKKLDKGNTKVSKVVCIDESEPSCDTVWQVGVKGVITPGTLQDVKEFAKILPTYQSAIKKAESMGIPSNIGLKVEGQGDTVKDISVGTDCVRGVSLSSTVFDPQSLSPQYHLGNGQFGSVICCTNLANGSSYAVKQVSLQKLNVHEILVQALASSQQHCAGSQFLAGGHAFYLEGAAVNMVMDLAAKTLEQLMQETRGCVKTETVRDIAQQGLLGLQFLSENNYVHLDIKPQNIGITHNNQVKILDFGSCGPVGLDFDRGMTPKYAAREVLLPHVLQNPNIRPLYVPKGDVYSYGACLISLVQGCHVWGHLDFAMKQYKEAIQYIFSHEEELFKAVPGHIDKQLYQLIKWMTRYDHAQRCTAEEALQHAFFQEPEQTHWQGGVPVYKMGASSQLDLRAACAGVDLEAAVAGVINMRLDHGAFQNPAVGGILKPPVQPQEQRVITVNKAALPVSVIQLTANRRKRARKVEAAYPAPAPEDCVLPDLDEIMTGKQSRGMEEEAVSIRKPAAEAPLVPVFEELMPDASDYTKEQQLPKKRNRTATDQPVMQACDNQFEFGPVPPMENAAAAVENAGFVDLRQRRAGGGKQMPKRIHATLPYGPAHRKGHPY